jgi:hypothetical protein
LPAVHEAAGRERLNGRCARSRFQRFFLFEPRKIGSINAQKPRYGDSYRKTAAFLACVTRRYDKSLVSELNAVKREGKYTDEVFKELTGRTVQQLDKEWPQTLKR